MSSRVTDAIREAMAGADEATAQRALPDAREIIERAGNVDSGNRRIPASAAPTRFDSINLIVRLAGAAAILTVVAVALALLSPRIDTSDATSVPDYMTSWVDSLYPERSWVVDEVSPHWNGAYGSEATYVDSVMGGVADEVVRLNDSPGDG